MTNEEAIKFLEMKRDELQKWLDITPSPKDTYPETWNFCCALDAAISALRAQHTTLDRSRWDGCEQCITGHTRPKFDFVYARGKYCQKCGRPLNERAWAELERRINGETD